MTPQQTTAKTSPHADQVHNGPHGITQVSCACGWASLLYAGPASTRSARLAHLGHRLDEFFAAPPRPKEKTRIYVAGPMSGLPDYNYPAFHAAADRLRTAGFHVENPAETHLPQGSPWEDFMRDALARMLTCDAVATLPNYEQSKGAAIEVALAKSLSIPTRPLNTWTRQARKDARP